MKAGTSVSTLFLTVICFSFLSQAHAEILTAQEYAFPITNPYFATATVAADHAQKPVRFIQMEPRPDRATVPLMKGRNKLNMALFQQQGPAPLVFMVPGLGGGGESGTSLYLAEKLFNQGYSVITLPVSFSWQYALGVSDSGLPGYTPRDAVEYYEFLKFVNSELAQKYHLQASGYSVVGFSMGGLLTAHLAIQDDLQHVFNFDRILLINPATDVSYGVQELDTLYAIGDRMSEDRKNYDMGFLITAGSKLIQGPMNQQSINQALKQVSQFNETDIQWLIGESFRESIQSVVYASQQVDNRGLLKQSADDLHQDARLDEAKQVTFREYMVNYVQPDLTGEPLSVLMAKSSIYAAKSIMQKNQNFYVMENVDDFVKKPTDVTFLEGTLKERLFLYPYGGHGGNMWFPRNQTDLLKIFPSVKTSQN